MAAISAAAIVLFEVLPFSSWESAMMMMVVIHPYGPYSNNNNINHYYFYYQQFFEDRKHIITTVATSRGGGGGGGDGGITSRSPHTIDAATSSSTTKNKLIHSSFRIEEDVIKSLEVAAEKRDISLSSLVNKILKNYVTSDMYFEELGFILVSKNFLRKTFDELSTKQIEELGQNYGLTIAREYISYFYPQVNSTTLIQFLDVWFKRFQSCQHRVDDDDYSNNDKKHHYYTVNHDINSKFSLALQSILEGLIEPIIKSTVEFTNVTATSITFSFEV
jgi:hypothetical protein